ncbi:hypothetical protein [Streptomyces sp. NPDC012888]|uniref:hypothetical protein n=1 Tax=Streptomyces sp. NPDC012888 TaxID=3364855 RepID=UPI0036AC458A
MRCRLLRLLSIKLGRRGAILSCYGLVWLLYGYGQITTPQPDQRGLQTLLALMPLTAWGWVWIAAGVVALVSAWAPPGRDAAAFYVLPLIVVPWMASYLVAWLLGDYPRGWVAAAVWAVITVPVLVTAGWPEPPRRKRAEPPYEC